MNWKIDQKSKLKTILLSFFLLLLGSCGRQGVNVTSSSFANLKSIPKGFPIGSSFAIISANKTHPLFSKEISEKITRILKQKGFSIESNTCANYHLVFDFGQESSVHTKNVPTYLPGYSTWRRRRYCYYYPGTVIYTPQQYTLFNKIISIKVYPVKDSTEKEPIWQSTTNAYEENSDLREAMDYLLVTAFKYFGKSTRKSIQTTINFDNKDVEKLRTNYFENIDTTE